MKDLGDTGLQVAEWSIEMTVRGANLKKINLKKFRGTSISFDIHEK
jgi:hypothetical protein